MKIQQWLFKLLKKQNVTDGRTDRRMHGRTDNVKTVYPTTNKVCGGYKNWKKEGKIRISIFIFIYTIHFAYLKVYTKFENTGSNGSWEICDRNFRWRKKKNEQIKELISNM